MRAVIQRVSKASVAVRGKIIGACGTGLLILVGVEDADTAADIEWLSQKIANLRIFNDAEGRMNLSVKEVNGEMLVISQFTLHASTKKGNRPSYIYAAGPQKALPMYKDFVTALQNELGKPIATGEFGAHMDVSLMNDGPVTIIIDTKNKQ
jgi:D-tyrosyl-tRNA(Tyr) deacylase